MTKQLHDLHRVMNRKTLQSTSFSIRNGNGSGFLIPGPDSRAKTHDPDPARLLNRFFFRGPNPPHRALLGHATSRPILLPNQKIKIKNKKLPDTDFLSNQTVGDTQESLDLNRLETLFFNYKIFPHQK